MALTKEQALLAIDREKSVLTDASDRIWDVPETAFQEFKSTEILCELLEKEGFTTYNFVFKNGFTRCIWCEYDRGVVTKWLIRCGVL